jgi:hypothetical protein
MGVYQDEIDNNIQPMIDKMTADLAELDVKIAFLDGLGTSTTLTAFKTAAQAHSDSLINDLYESEMDDKTDTEMQTFVANHLHLSKLRHGGSEHIGSADTLLGDSMNKTGSELYRESNITKDITALESKKTAWAAKELDSTDTTEYTAMPPALADKPAGW